MSRELLIQLVRSNVFSRKIIHSLLKKDPSFKSISTHPPTHIAEKLNIPLHLAKQIKKVLNNEELKTIIQQDKRYCKIITIFDDNYPLLLKNISDAPLILYVIGNISLLNKQPNISVIGSRIPSKNAWDKLELITTPLIKQGWVIVSGFARGIDSFAHKLTLNYDGATIAVLGHGFNYLYPRENKGLFELIKSRGLVITEYPPHIPPKKYHFPERNRIISGLTLATLVIEAKSRSGTLITVNQALEQGRDVYAVPDSPLLEQAEGCHELIRDGATIVTTAEHIVNDWPESRQLTLL